MVLFLLSIYKIDSTQIKINKIIFIIIIFIYFQNNKLFYWKKKLIYVHKNRIIYI